MNNEIDIGCNVFGGPLFPPDVVSGKLTVLGNLHQRGRQLAVLLADYVCCGRAFAWAGNPPALKALTPVVGEVSVENDR
jgi:hypothetical protein